MRPNTKQTTIPEALFALALGLLILALTSCGGASSSAGSQQQEEQQPAEEASSSYAGNFVGQVQGTNAFIGVVVDRENQTLSYVCDGQSIAEWFQESVSDDGAIDLTSDSGAKLLVNVAGGEGAEGTVTFPNGEERLFEAVPAEGETGLYRAEESIEGEEFVGGWILLNNGEERGAVKNTSSGFISQDIGLPARASPWTGSSSRASTSSG